MIFYIAGCADFSLRNGPSTVQRRVCIHCCVRETDDTKKLSLWSPVCSTLLHEDPHEIVQSFLPFTRSHLFTERKHTNAVRSHLFTERKHTNAGALNNFFQLATTTGILVAQVVNYGVHNAGPWAWRISFAVAGGTTAHAECHN